MTMKERVRLIRYIEPPRVKRRKAWSKDGKPFLKVPVFHAEFAMAGTLPLRSERELRALGEEMAELINHCRLAHPVESNHAGPLHYSARLAEVAQRHSEDMRDRRYSGHLDPDGRSVVHRLRAAGIRFRACGENIAGGPSEGRLTGFKSIEDAHWGLFKEPRYQDNHRRSLLHDGFHRVGIGIAQNRDGTLIITQVFTD